MVPKDIFHHAFASHQDWEGYCSDDLKSPHFHQSGFDCGFDELAVNSVYHFNNESNPGLVFTIYQDYHPFFEASCLLQSLPLKENRGPPMV